MSVIWILVIVIAVILFGIIAIFNRLVGLKNRTDEAWSDIDVQLKRRYDLIPNLIETVKGYAKHEKELFEKVTQARTEAMKSKGLVDKAKAENQITEALKSVFAVAENYPNLKANENFVELQKEIISNAVRFMEKGSVLIYSTCTIEPEENQEVVYWLLDNYKDLQIDPAENYLPQEFCKDGFMQTFPHIHGIDGAFAARIIKV